MLDANAHGAGDNPEFIKKWDDLKLKTDCLRDAMRAAGRSTKEYDENIRGDTITFLKARGLSDEQVRDALANAREPLEAVKPYLGGDKDSRSLSENIRLSNTSQDAANVSVSKANAGTEQPLVIDIDAMNSRLAAAGLAAGADREPAGHGLSIQKPGKDPSVIVR